MVFGMGIGHLHSVTLKRFWTEGRLKGQNLKFIGDKNFRTSALCSTQKC